MNETPEPTNRDAPRLPEGEGAAAPAGNGASVPGVRQLVGEGGSTSSPAVVAAAR